MLSHWVRTVLEDATAGTSGLPDQAFRDLDRIAAVVERQQVYVFRRPELEEIAEALSGCEQISHLARQMWQAATATGFQHATVFLIEQGNAPAFHTRVCTSYPRRWLERYAVRSYQFVDPIFARAQASDAPFRFHEAMSDAPQVQAFWADATEHGIGSDGLCMSFTLSRGTRVGVSFASGNGRAAVDRAVHLDGSDLQFLGRLAAETFTYLAALPETPQADQMLSVSELRFLQMLVTSNDPEAALRMTPGFGSNAGLQAGIREKLGVSTILQAVAVASANNWFDRLPYDVGEVSSAFSGLAGWGLVMEDEDAPAPARLMSEAKTAG